jgi:2'-hydroxyisoflavone reductase
MQRTKRARVFMLNRRERIHKTVSSSALAFSGVQQSFGTPKSPGRAAKPLRVLILGGTGHIGPSHVQAAVKRGHKVAVFSRGKNAAQLPPGVELLRGDRNGDLKSIKNRDWDAVLDIATFGPVWVRTLGEALQGRVGHYTFISTASVYDTPGNNKQGTDESSKLLEYTGTIDPYSNPRIEGHYGSMKVLCEREAEKQFPGRVLVFRPGYIVGPGDAVGAFTYLPARLAEGGEFLAGGDPSSRVQWIDMRDLADWAILLAERGDTGVFNTIGPAMPMDWITMLRTLRDGSSRPTTLTWVPAEWLAERKITSWSNLLFWPTEEGIPGLMRMSSERARAQGLTFRPLQVTARDTLAWYNALPTERQNEFLMGLSGKSTLEDSMAHEKELLREWHAQEKSTA